MAQDASDNGHLRFEVDESTPLIQGQAEPAGAAVDNVAEDVAHADTPLPMVQVAVLCLSRLCETLSFFVILP